MSKPLPPEDKDAKVCFVVMGFGKKTDFESGRTLDLDATYEAIIQPAVREQGMRCIRADDIIHSGSIDVEMYEMLLRADLVIADISTGNVNAVYELGVRHALRPNSTIIMTEDGGKLYFDLNHTSTFKYAHYGEDIASREAKRAVPALSSLIAETMAAGRPDSPVYTFLPKLQHPRMTDDKYADLLDEAETAQAKLAGHMHEGDRLMKLSQPGAASVSFRAADAMRPAEPYILQKLALAIYKSEKPSVVESLLEAGRVLEPLNPESSNDPETLGLSGAVCKRLWLATGQRVYLDSAIRHYGRGFEVRRDYYNGENLALCYEYRGQVETDVAEVKYDFMSARKVRESMSALLNHIIEEPDFADRPDRSWIYATLANCSLTLGQVQESERFEQLFFLGNTVVWEIETYQKGKAEILGMNEMRLKYA